MWSELLWYRIIIITNWQTSANFSKLWMVVLYTVMSLFFRYQQAVMACSQGQVDIIGLVWIWKEWSGIVMSWKWARHCEHKVSGIVYVALSKQNYTNFKTRSCGSFYIKRLAVLSRRHIYLKKPSLPIRPQLQVHAQEWTFLQLMALAISIKHITRSVYSTTLPHSFNHGTCNPPLYCWINLI